MGDPEAVSTLVEQVEASFPGLDTLFNNAGVSWEGELCTPDGVLWLERALRVNTVAPLNVTTSLLPVLKRNPSPLVVNVSSALVAAPMALMGGYCASKAALHSLTLSMRHMLAGIEADKDEVRPGQSAQLAFMARLAPGMVFKMLNPTKG